MNRVSRAGSQQGRRTKYSNKRRVDFIYRVKSGKMYRDGLFFYRSVNGVWMTERVPIEHLEKEGE